MVQAGVHHLPIVDEGKVIGVVDLLDVVRARRTAAEAESEHLMDYLSGGPAPAGSQ